MIVRALYLSQFAAAVISVAAAAQDGRVNDSAGKNEASPPATGDRVPELAEFDRFMGRFLRENSIPGGALAIANRGKIVYSRGFGLADLDAKTPASPKSLFRIASISKPITAVAVLKLVDQGKLRLDDKVVDYLDFEPHLEPGGKVDARWNDITLAHCLSHTGGWDRDKSYDPMFEAPRMAKSLGVELPISTGHIIRYMRGQPLDFDPGERYAYSNFGYCLLGRVIEKATGRPYEKFVQQEVFAPLGINGPRIGRSLESQRAPGEVRYYDIKNRREQAIVGPGAGKDKVPISYGAWHHEALDAHGGWIASVEDLVRFGAAFDSHNGKRLLKPETRRLMIKPQAVVTPLGKDGNGGTNYGLGWLLVPEGDAVRFQHGGALPCTAAILIQMPNGVTLAALFNQGQTAEGQWLGRLLDQPLAALVRGVEDWPAGEIGEK